MISGMSFLQTSYANICCLEFIKSRDVTDAQAHSVGWKMIIGVHVKPFQGIEPEGNRFFMLACDWWRVQTARSLKTGACKILSISC